MKNTMRVLKSEDNPELQLQKEIIKICRDKLAIQAQKRKETKNKIEWNTIKESFINHIKSSFHHSVLDRKNPLNTRMVSEEDFPEYRIENVVFESMPGWEVNATVYLPKNDGVYPAVVCPTGHSSKTRESYQTSAQVFARNGYVAISFDPPGCQGEIAYMNNHFTNGVIGYLTGIWSNSHFVIDAIRCIDYLETRKDVDMGNGVTVTGVSGGGCTTIYVAILDDRVKFFAPVCCLARHEEIHLTDLYTSCPEQFANGFIKQGIDYVELIAVQVPKPCLVIAGQQDELFDYQSTQKLYKEVEKIYGIYNVKSNVGLYIQKDSGHAYTVEMAGKVVQWMNRIIKKEDKSPLVIKKENIKIQPADKLKCYPSNNVNMFTVNKLEGQRLEDSRVFPQENKKREYLKEKTRKVLGLNEYDYCYSSVWEEQNPSVRWSHQLQKIDINIEDSVHVPGLLYKRVRSSNNKITEKRPAMLFIDEYGKWKGFYHSDYLAKAGRFLEREGIESEPLILSIDISGLGELKPQPTSYDMAWWNDIERILTYLSISSGKPIMGLRVRDAHAALNYLKSREDIDENRIIIAGRGIGAIVAIHTSLFAKRFQKLILWDMLVNYKAMTEQFPFHWPQSIIIPDILKYYDLQDLLEVILCEEKIVINPLDAQRKPVNYENADKIYNNKAKVFAQLEDDEAKNVFVNMIIGK
jgi:dienelactone hydrolase